MDESDSVLSSKYETMSDDAFAKAVERCDLDALERFYLDDSLVKEPEPEIRLLATGESPRHWDPGSHGPARLAYPLRHIDPPEMTTDPLPQIACHEVDSQAFRDLMETLDQALIETLVSVVAASDEAKTRLGRSKARFARRRG